MHDIIHKWFGNIPKQLHLSCFDAKHFLEGILGLKHGERLQSCEDRNVVAHCFQFPKGNTRLNKSVQNKQTKLPLCTPHFGWP